MAIKRAFDAGITVVGSAGNDTADACTRSPASAPEALAIAATTNTGTRSSFSNFGSCVDLFAPGSNIMSAYIGSNSTTRSLSGTSMACPHVAGVAALYRGRYPNLCVQEVSSAIIREPLSAKLKMPKILPIFFFTV